ncbi:hypothetical protein Ahy_B07g086315 isoform A [Arachis hypogaea]|uniref:Uncharacterized protein n=1 Tax=Arachis hypogaea TaxID=3818 RepID=A0A444Y9Q5_ARAHY|nr:hypothetical protein Ahy_B07g086315 isoform A [Arachis hypogaea]
MPHVVAISSCRRSAATAPPRAPSPVVLASFSATSFVVRAGKTATIALLLHPPLALTSLAQCILVACDSPSLATCTPQLSICRDAATTRPSFATPTGSCAPVVRPDLFPPETWIPFNKKFTAANKEIFTIDLISKENVGFQIFLGATTWLRVLGSYLPEQDVLFGFDAYYRTQGISIWPDGLKYKKNFLPFVTTTGIFEISKAPSEYEDVQKRLLKTWCDSHDKFVHPLPLWKNQEFYIRLPFKKNEDINLTKTTHSGMNPEDLKLAKEECAALL